MSGHIDDAFEACEVIAQELIECGESQERAKELSYLIIAALAARGYRLSLARNKS